MGTNYREKQRQPGAWREESLSLIHIYTPNIAEVIIAKQRNGPIGTIQLMWRPELTKFANLAR